MVAIKHSFTYYYYYYFHIFTENLKSGCDLKITYSRGQFDLKIAVRLVAVTLATATATATLLKIQLCTKLKPQLTYDRKTY